MNNRNKLLFIGSIMVDVICPIHTFPQPGQGVVSEEFTMSLGGCAYNAANIARQLGADCHLMAPLGVGAYAGFAREQLAAKGLTAMQIDTDLDCGSAVCLVTPDGERTMITLPGIERKFEKSWFDDFDASDYGMAFICGYELDGTGGDEIADFLAENPQMQVVFAPGPVICRIAPEKIARMNELRAFWHLNEVEAMSYTGIDDVVEAGKAIAKASGNTVIVTEGSLGAHLFTHEGDTVIHQLIPTIAVQPFDTIGAGDNHIGTLMAARAAGKTWTEAINLANRVSAAVCMVQGATLTDRQFAALNLSL